MNLNKFIPYLLVLAGVGTLVWGIRDYLLGGASQNWPTTQGIVRSSTVVEKDHGEPGENDMPTYEVRISYSYAVEGKQYDNNRRRFTDFGSYSERYAQGVADQYPVGSPVRVYYQPDNPANSVLEPGVNWLQVWFLPFMGVILLGGGGVLILIARSSRTNKRGLRA